MNLFIVKPCAEQFAISECALKNINTTFDTPGIIKTDNEITDDFNTFCFPFWILLNVKEISGNSCEKPIDYISDWFCKEILNTRFETNWNLFWLSYSDNGFIPDHNKTDRIKEKIKKRVSRVARLAQSIFPDINTKVNGLFIIESHCEKKIYIAREAVFMGQRRMKDDPLAPSRSYLKIEEAFTIFNHFPKSGEVVCDLGAAPGGWTWAALKRDATVYAIDNGPLKNGPLGHPNVRHIRQDAYTWQPNSIDVDWLFCDMVDQPLKVLDRITLWFSNNWCKYAIVNFKYGHNDPINVLNQLYSSKGLIKYSKQFICRHLFHDRDEITIMASIRK